MRRLYLLHVSSTIWSSSGGTAYATIGIFCNELKTKIAWSYYTVFKSCWRLPKTRPGVPALASSGYCIVFIRRLYYALLSCWSMLSQLITKSAAPFGVSVFSLTILVHYMSNSIWSLVSKFIFFNFFLCIVLLALPKRFHGFRNIGRGCKFPSIVRRVDL
jgi:hypothetical protein